MLTLMARPTYCLAHSGSKAAEGPSGPDALSACLDITGMSIGAAKSCKYYGRNIFRLCLHLQEGDGAYYKLRLERTNAKLVGVRAKRAAEAAAEEAAKAK